MNLQDATTLAGPGLYGRADDRGGRHTGLPRASYENADAADKALLKAQRPRQTPATPILSARTSLRLP